MSVKDYKAAIVSKDKDIAFVTKMYEEDMKRQPSYRRRGIELLRHRDKRRAVFLEYRHDASKIQE